MLRVKYDYESYENIWVFAYSEILVCLVSWLGRISSVGLAQTFMVATLILGLRLRITEAGHLAVFYQKLSGGKAAPLNYISWKIAHDTIWIWDIFFLKKWLLFHEFFWYVYIIDNDIKIVNLNKYSRNRLKKIFNSFQSIFIHKNDNQT